MRSFSRAAELELSCKPRCANAVPLFLTVVTALKELDPVIENFVDESVRDFFVIQWFSPESGRPFVNRDQFAAKHGKLPGVFHLVPDFCEVFPRVTVADIDHLFGSL